MQETRFHILENEMELTPSNILAWRIPCTEEPGGLQFLGVARESEGTLVTLQQQGF